MSQQTQVAVFCHRLAGLTYAGLVHRRLPIIAALLAMALVLPSLSAGWVSDDWYHQFAILAPGNARDVIHSPADMFKFFDGDPARTRKLMDLGVIPWWTCLSIKGAFWRPLTVLTHRLDYCLWPASAFLMHAQSILWYGAVVAAVACLYRRFLGAAWVAGAATFLYAIDDAHGMPVGFLANRNALLATVFGVLAVLAHDRWRRDGWRVGAWAGPALLGLSLLSAEAGVATCAYLAAYALIIDRGSWRARCASLVSYFGVVVAWRILWMRLGYGVLNAGYYVDPVSDSGRFVVSVLRNAPVLLLGQWALPPSDLFMLLGPVGATLLWLGAVLFVSICVIALFPLLRQDRTARFWAIGMALSLVPVCAAFPMDRLLFFVGVGAMGLLASFLGLAFGGDRQPLGRLSRRFVVSLAWIFIGIHCVIAPIALPFRAAYPLGPQEFIDQFQVQGPLDRSVEKQDVVIVNAPSEVLAGYLPIVSALNGWPVPRHTRVLAPALYSVSISRQDAYTLVVRPEDSFLSSVGSRLLRDENHPMSPGERVELTGLSVEVTAVTADGRPAEARFWFAVPLEDPSLRWLQWKAGVFVPFVPPAVGQGVDLRQPDPAIWPFRESEPAEPARTGG
jgi:hypothetical protein